MKISSDNLFNFFTFLKSKKNIDYPTSYKIVKDLLTPQERKLIEENVAKINFVIDKINEDLDKYEDMDLLDVMTKFSIEEYKDNLALVGSGGSDYYQLKMHFPSEYQFEEDYESIVNNEDPGYTCFLELRDNVLILKEEVLEDLIDEEDLLRSSNSF